MIPRKYYLIKLKIDSYVIIKIVIFFYKCMKIYLYLLILTGNTFVSIFKTTYKNIFYVFTTIKT